MVTKAGLTVPGNKDTCFFTFVDKCIDPWHENKQTDVHFMSTEINQAWQQMCINVL